MAGEIARAEFVAIDARGAERPVSIVLRTPEPTGHGDWACVIDADPSVGGPRGGIVGQDAIQAISLALAFVHSRLVDFREKGGRIVFCGEPRVDVPLDAQFGNVRALRSMKHVVLLGDSIFDDASYTQGLPDVVTHLRTVLPQGVDEHVNPREFGEVHR